MAAPAQAGELLTVREAAARLGVSEKTVRRWMARHEIGYYSLSARKVVLPGREIARLLAAAYRPPQPGA